MAEQAQEQATAAPAETHPEAQPNGTEVEPFFVAKTQDDLNKKVGDVRTEGRESGKSERDTELLQKWSEFGIESLDDVEAVLDAQRTIETELEGEQITDLKKQHKADLKAKDSEVEALHKHYALRDALRDAGINAERIPLALKVADLDSLSVKDGSVEGLEAVVEGVKQSSPEWFGDQKPRSVGRGSSPGTSTGMPADVAPGLARLRMVQRKT